MRITVLVVIALAACAADEVQPVDGSLAAMAAGLDAEDLPPAPDDIDEETDRVLPPPDSAGDSTFEQTTQTLDCPTGGTVRVQIQRRRHDAPVDRSGSIHWTYDACGTWDFGTIDGRANFRRVIEEGPPWIRELFYYADLEYSGREEGDCDAYVSYKQAWQTAEHQLDLAATCPHPVRQWWQRLGI